MAKAKKANRKGALSALLFATWTLMANFWSWSLLGPLATQYVDELSLSPLEISLLLAAPVLIGSLGRILIGIITDKYGGHQVFTVATVMAVLPVLLLAVADSYNGLLSAATLLGVAGTTFVIGIPFVSAWFPPERRGFILGFYALGNAGTALSGLATPSLSIWLGRDTTFLLVAAVLAFSAFAFQRFTEDSPDWKPAKGSSLKRFAKAASSRLAWDLSMMYIITFGAFVAFGVYLPILLKVSYGLSLTDAAARGAGFVVIATLARPFGGWLSDKFGGHNVVRFSLLSVSILAGYVALQPDLHIFTSAGYLSLAFALGCGNGAVFALIGKLAKADSVGSVTGIVGAMGGLGGFVPPLILGLTYARTESYAPALVMLSISAALVLVYIHQRFANNYKVAGKAA